MSSSSKDLPPDSTYMSSEKITSMSQKKGCLLVCVCVCCKQFKACSLRKNNIIKIKKEEIHKVYKKINAIREGEASGKSLTYKLER